MSSSARGGWALAPLLFLFGAAGCAAPSADDSEDSPSEVAPGSVAAGNATRQELGVERWQLAGSDDGTMEVAGIDGHGSERATVTVRGIHIDGVLWVEIASETKERASFRFRMADDGEHVVFAGTESIREKPAVWRATSLADADLRAASTGGSLVANAIEPTILPLDLVRPAKSKLINEMGSCLSTAGDAIGALGSATGNDTLCAVGEACSGAGYAMQCYGNYGGPG